MTLHRVVTSYGTYGIGTILSPSWGDDEDLEVYEPVAPDPSNGQNWQEYENQFHRLSQQYEDKEREIRRQERLLNNLKITPAARKMRRIARSGSNVCLARLLLLSQRYANMKTEAEREYLRILNVELTLIDFEQHRLMR